MKRIIHISICLFLLWSCKKDDTATYDAIGLITGADLTLCICHCGGYFIRIDDNFYRFEADELPKGNSLNLAAENLPLSVNLNWSFKTPNSDCDATDRIIISAIEEQ